MLTFASEWSTSYIAAKSNLSMALQYRKMNDTTVHGAKLQR